MAEPQISRRCPSCGASFRAGALFCPQCGTAVSTKTSVGASNAVQANSNDTISDFDPTATLAELAPQTVAEQNSGHAPEAHAGNVEGAIAGDGVQPPRASAPTIADNNSGSTPGVLAAGDGATHSIAMGQPTMRVQHAATAARDVLEERVLPQVEKLRKASSVVLGKSSYDSGLRFIFIAVILFVLSLVLLLLSKYMG